MSGRFEDIAERYLNVKIRGSSEFMTACPFCSGDSSLQFNIDKGLWVCFRCDERGTAKRLVRRLGGIYSDPAISVEAIYQQLDRLKAKQKVKQQRVYPESYLARFNFPDEYWSEVRGFSDKTIREWNLGYDPLKDRHTIPYRSPDGDLLGVIQRLKGDVFPRYIYDEGFDRQGSLFGSWKITQRKIAVVEGSTDVLACFESGFESAAQYGSSITRKQIRLLHRLGVKELVLFYDYDEAGRKAEEKTRQLAKGFVLRSVIYDEDKYCWHKKLCGCSEHTWRTIGKCQKKRLCKCGRKHEMDPGSLGRKERKRMFQEAVLVGSKEDTWHTRRSAR